ncbi:MAG: YicC/YloC family endoribonuclease [Akkermansiaceae bacterium]|jgi:uncharacterized protein (TIGR00255 family)
MQSMTGFGRGEFSNDHLVAQVEITSVNRKQADIQFNMPRGISSLESGLRKTVLEKVSRGRLNVSISLEKTGGDTGSVVVDESKARELETAFQHLSATLERPIQLEAADFLRVPDLISFTEDSGFAPEEAATVVEPALDQALEALVRMRTDEGADLRADMLARLDILSGLSEQMAGESPRVVERQRELLHSRLRDAGVELDFEDERLAKEIALFADRCDISEETTRLASHLKRFREYLESTEPVGRSLDFLCQEINREFNTIGSKANNAGIGQDVVTAKTELEKIREQVQNLE